MRELNASQVNFLKFLRDGGLAAIANYGKMVQTNEVLSRPVCMHAGLRSIDMLIAAGFVRYGDPSPYKSGTVTPIVLTEAGKEAVSA